MVHQKVVASSPPPRLHPLASPPGMPFPLDDRIGDFRKRLQQEIEGEPAALLVGGLERIDTGVVGVLHDLAPASPGVFAEHLHLCLRVLYLPPGLEAPDVLQIASVHGEDVVELIEVTLAELHSEGCPSSVWAHYHRAGKLTWRAS